MAREGHLRDTRNHTQERELGQEATTSAFRKASFLGRGIKTFFRGSLAPGIKGAETQKPLSRRQPRPAHQGRRVRGLGCWDMWPALPSPCMGKGPAVTMQALGNGRWLALFEVVEGKDLGRRPQLKMTPRRRHQLQFKPNQRDQLWGFSFSSICNSLLKGRGNVSSQLLTLRGPMGPD